MVSSLIWQEVLFFSKDCFCTAKGSCHIVFKSPFRYAIKNNGDSVNGTKYRSAGWAALKTSLEIVAVSNPRKYPNKEQWKYEIRYQLFGRGIPASAIRCACALL